MRGQSPICEQECARSEGADELALKGRLPGRIGTHRGLEHRVRSALGERDDPHLRERRVPREEPGRPSWLALPGVSVTSRVESIDTSRQRR